MAEHADPGLPVMDPVEATAIEVDRGLVRSVRRRLVLWSGGVTLAILVVLGTIIYVAVANSLAAQGTQVLEARAEAIVESLRRPGSPRLGLAFGGRASGTIAFLVDPSDRAVGPPGSEYPEGLPDTDSIKAARETGRDVRTVRISDVPVRILSDDVPSGAGLYVIQVVADRTSEQQTLDVLAIVLVVGGLLAVVSATAFGAVYARRALVPIRDSLASQRSALRRQREFAADASHELRTPLTVIRASVEHLERHGGEPVATVGSALDDIRSETDHLARLVDELLLLARSDSGAIELERVPLDMGDAATDAAASLATLAQERSVRVVVDPEPCLVIGDPTRLRQVLVILVDNAIRHSPPDGEVRVTARALGAEVGIVVEDEGSGIRDEDLPHLFERFWRAAGAPEGGTGLGLSIAAWIVERHGGRIAAVNRAEGGARFIVAIPAAPREPAGPSTLS
jgi:signal transduction histidine kinase